jgi:hypothetical protein
MEKKIINLVNVAGFTHAQRLSKICMVQALLVFQVPGAFAADSYTWIPNMSVRPQVTIPEPVNGILSDIALGIFAKTIDNDSHRVETQLQ